MSTKPERWDEANELLDVVTEKYEELHPTKLDGGKDIADKHVRFLMAHNMWECSNRDGIPGLGNDKAKFLHFAMKGSK